MWNEVMQSGLLLAGMFFLLAWMRNYYRTRRFLKEHPEIDTEDIVEWKEVSRFSFRKDWFGIFMFPSLGLYLYGFWLGILTDTIDTDGMFRSSLIFLIFLLVFTSAKQRMDRNLIQRTRSEQSKRRLLRILHPFDNRTGKQSQKINALYKALCERPMDVAAPIHPALTVFYGILSFLVAVEFNSGAFFSLHLLRFPLESEDPNFREVSFLVMSFVFVWLTLFVIFWLGTAEIQALVRRIQTGKDPDAGIDKLSFENEEEYDAD